VPSGNTGPSSKIIAWTSFVADTRTSKVYSVANGGHSDYAGNEVDELDLEREAPVWTQKLAPTPNGQIANGSYYGDGRPTSRHTYYGATLDTFDDRIMLFGGAHWSDGGALNTVDSYNIGSNSYSPQGTHPNLPNSNHAFFAADPATGNLYAVFSPSDFRRWNRATNTWSQPGAAGSAPTAGLYQAAATDTTRNRILFAGGSNSAHSLYNIATNTFTQINFTGANGATVTSMQQAALVYVPALDRFLVRMSGAGGTVYQIDPATFEVTTVATAGGGSVPSTQNGPFNKFVYVPRLGGAVYVPSYTGNSWFLRLH
jgi:hypothetical protein